MKKRTRRLFYALIALLALALAALAGCGGSKKVKLTFETFGGTEIPPIVAEAGTDISGLLPKDPERLGYVFEGWYEDKDAAGSAVTLPSVMPEKGATYYAKWREAFGTLTLTTNDGGTLSETSFELRVGENVKSFLEGKEPVSVKQGLTFAGWYLGSVPIADDVTMSERGLTVSAKYTAEYTMTVYTQDAGGNYGEGKTETGAAFYGEPFDCTVAHPAPAHFTYDVAMENARLSSPSLGVGETFTLYLARELCGVRYDANPPEGVSYTGTMRVQTALYGAEIKALACGFTLDGVYRFAGWALSEDGDVVYRAGDVIEDLDENGIHLYARWEGGLRDLFGGQDVLYPSVTEENTVYLERDGVEEQKGTYDPDTMLFTIGGLSGRLLPESYSFLYFRDTYERTYHDLEGTDATLTIQENGVVIYTNGEGASVSGTYGIDFETGYFKFYGEEEFLFNLYEPTGEGEIVFRRQNLEEEGYYYDAETGIILYLNGLNGLEYHYNNTNYEYQIFGEPVLTVSGYYEWLADGVWNGNEGLYLAYTRDFSGILKQFTFHLDLTAPVPAVPGGYEDVGTVKALAVMDDGVRNEYNDKWEGSDETLYLDGYGEGAYGAEEGTYEVITWLWSYETDSGDVIDDYLLVRFVTQTTYYYFRLDLDYGDYEIDRVIAKSGANSGLVGAYPIGDVFVLNAMFDGFLYVFENGDAEFWTVYDYNLIGEPVYVLYSELMSSVEKKGTESAPYYTFLRTQNKVTGEYYENTFDFTVDPVRHTAAIRLPDEHDTVTVAEGLVLDYTAGTAAYQGEEIAYTSTIGYIDFYTFTYGGTDHLFYTESGAREFHPVDPAALYSIEFPFGEPENFYYGALYFAGERVYLAFRLSSGLIRFVGEGTAAPVAGKTDEYDFTLTAHLAEMEDEEFTDYDAFRFKRFENAGGGTFVQQSTPYTFSNFTTDGYGVYLYTAGEDSYEGSIVFTIGLGKGQLFYFLPSEDVEDAPIFVLAADPEGNKVDRVLTDAGFWYEMDANNGITQDRYLVLDGRGNAFFYSYDGLTDETSVSEATYARTKNYAEGFLEYTITPKEGAAVNYILGTYPVNLGGEVDTMPLYQAQIAHRIGDFEVKGGGSVFSAGYPNRNAVYIDAEGNEYYGNMYLGTCGETTTDRDFTNGADGKQVRFWIWESGLPTSTSFYFDIDDSGELDLRSLPYGNYAFASFEGVQSGAGTLYLDGHGGATYTENGDEVQGTYEPLTGGGYLFEADGKTFRFLLDTLTADDTTTYVYRLFTEDANHVYLGKDWSVLALDGYGGASYTNCYGDVFTGNVLFFAEGLGYFESARLSAVFSYGDGTFALIDHSSHLASFYSESFGSVIFGEAKLIAEGVEYFYTVEGNTVTRYAVAGDHASSTIPLFGAGKTYSYNEKEYTRYEGGALTFTLEGHADAALVFTPDGAQFTVNATLAGEGGYTVTAEYLAGHLFVTLGYRAGADTLLEEYDLTLHFTGEGNTFQTAPKGSSGTYTDRAFAGLTATIDGRRVGGYYLADALTLTLPVQDTAGNPIAYEGTFSAAKEDTGNSHYSFGYAKALPVTGKDGVVYTVRFFLDDGGKQFILHSVSVESSYNIRGAGKLTVTQLWAGSAYIDGYEKLDVMRLTLPESGVTTTTEWKMLTKTKAALVRQNMNTTTGSYDYSAYVFDLTFGENGFVENAESEGEYGYAIAYSGIRYEISFLYLMDGEDMTVVYLLSFKEYDSTKRDAVFEKNDDGSWTVTAGGSVYRVKIVPDGGGFAIEMQ